MAQIQVNLEGVSVAVENRRVPLDVLKLDAQNPRIGLYKDSQPKTAFSDGEIRHAIVNRSPDAYTKLRESIEINQGIISGEKNKGSFIKASFLSNTRFYVSNQSPEHGLAEQEQVEEMAAAA